MRKTNRIQTETGLEKLEARELLSGSSAATGGDFQRYMQQELSSSFNRHSSSSSSQSSYGGMNFGGSQYGGRGRHGFGRFGGMGRGFGGFFSGQFQGTFTLGNSNSGSSQESDSSSDTSEATESTATEETSTGSVDCPTDTPEDTSSEDTSQEDTLSEDTSEDTSEETSTSNTGTFSGTFSGSFFGRGFGRRRNHNFRQSSSQQSQSSQQSSSQEENVQYYNGTRYTMSSKKKSNGKKITYENPNAPKGQRKLDYNVLAGTFKAHSPIAFDLDGSGAIETTGASTAKNRSDTSITSTVSFDIDGNGVKENIQWMAGGGDGLLVDDRDGKAAQNMDGARLFGDQGGQYSSGFEKLALLDKNGDGALTGKELKGLKMWQDNGDAQVQAGEMKDLGAVGVHRVSVVTKANTEDPAVDELMQSTANRGSKTILTEDVWFGTVS